MSAFDELLEQRKNRKAKGGTAFDELLATREYNKTQKAAYDAVKGINLGEIRSAVIGGNYIDKNTMDKYKSDLSTYVNNYSRLDTGNEDEKNQTLNDLTDFQNNFLKYYDYMTQFGNETDFNKNRYGWLTDDENFVDSDENVKGRQDIYEANKKRIDELNTQISEYVKKHFGHIGGEATALLEEKNALIAENRQYEHGQGRTDSYFNLTKNEDFEKDSQNRDYTNPSRQDYQNYQARIDNGITYDANGVGRDVFGEVFDEGYYDRIKEPETTDRLGLFLSTPEDQRQEAYASPAGLENGWEMVMKEGNSGDWDQLRDKEIDIYYYLLENSGKDAADKYLDEMTQELNRRATVKRTEAINEADGLEKVMLNIASVPFSVYGGILSFAENALNTLSGNEINPYSQAHYFSNTAQAVRGSTAQDIDEWTGGANLLGISLGDAYQAGMSALDSALGATSMGRGYTYAMGAGAASSEAKRLYEQGASSAQIAAGSLLAGTAEAFFEHFSLEHYFTKFIESPPASRTKAILQVLAQGGIEASEEVATEIANTISNAVVMGSESEWHDLMQKYKDEGESDAAAFGHALVNDVLFDKVWGAGAGGLISGVLMGGFGTTIGRVQYNNAVKAHGQGIIDSRGVDTLRQLANDMAGVNAPAVNAEASTDVNADTDTSPQLVGKDAKSVSKALSNVDSKASAKNVGRLSVAVENAINGKNKSDIQQSLVKGGMSQKDAKKASEILSKVMEDSEYEFTDKEVSKLFDDTSTANEDGITAVGKVLADIIANPASEQNMRNLELAVARLGRDLKTPRVATKKTKSGDTAILSDVDVKDKVSLEGKTVNAETNEEISINTGDAIKSVKTVNGQRRVLLNTDKGVVDSLNVKYASEDQAYLIESVADLNPAVANSIIKHYDGKMDVKQYVNGMREGILLYGKYNFTGVGTDISRNSFFARLSEADQALALEIGKSVAKSQTNKAQKSIAKTIRNAAENASEANKTTEGTNTNVKAKKGKVRFEKGAVATTTAQKNGVKLAAHLAKALGIDIYFYDSKVDAKYASKNGWFNKADNSIHLDLQAGDLNEQTIAFTMAHELTHFIEKWSPEKYKIFSDFLIEQYGKHGMSVEDMLSEKMDILGKDDPDFAMSELVADACEEMLLDSDAMVKLAQLRAKDAGLFEKIKAKIAEILNNLKNIYAEGNFKPNSAEANNLRKMTDVIEQMHRMFEDAAVDAAQNYQAVTESAREISNAANSGENTKYAENKKSPAGDKVQYSVKHNIVDVNGKVYDSVIKVDNKSTAKTIKYQNFAKFIKGMAGKTVGVTYINGKKEEIVFAKANERVSKNGKKSHPVLGELIAMKGILRKSVIANISDVLKISFGEESNQNNEHGWLDKNGWTRKKCYILSDDVIYPVYLSIANTADGRKLLYSVNVNVKEGINVDSSVSQKKETVETIMPSGSNDTTLNSKSQEENQNSTRRKITADKEKNKILFAERHKVYEINGSQYQQMVDHFGMTRNFDVAGYMLGNGAMLDFSGKHWGDDYSTSRQVDHRDIQEVLESENNGVDAMVNMIANGNIRLMPEVGGINLAVMPNETQISRLKDYIRHFNGEVIVDIDAVGGDTIHSFTYNRGINPAAVIRDIKAYFEEGTIPQEQPDYRQFLYSKRNPNAISDRTLLANALESTAQNDIEKKYIADYKANIDKLEGLQAHLDEVNAEIKELSFGKGKRDSEKLKKLNEDKVKTANRINILDKKLLRLEAAKPLEQVLEREKDKAAKRAKAKADEAMARYREKSAAKLDDTVKKYQDARKKNVENRNKTAVRNKIKKVVGELDSLLNRGDRKRNVKNGMRDAVSDAISTAKVLFSAMDAQDIILDGVTTATPQEQIQIDKYVKLVDEMDKIAEQIENDGESTELVKQMDEKYKKLKYIERQLKDLIVRERIRLQTEGTSAALQKLADAYRELSASSKTHINGSYDQNVYDMIINLKDTVGGTSIQDMSIEQLESVYKVYKLIKHTVTEANKIFREGKAEDVATTSERVCREFVANGEPLDSRSKLRISGENFLWNELKPAYAIKMMNSPTMSEMYHDFELAEDIVATDIREAYEFASKTRDKYNYNDWDLKATVPVKLSSGTTVELTVKKMMSIYAYSKRDHALEHMSGGGFVLNNKETFRKTKGNGKKSLLKYVPTARYAFRIYDIDLQNIADILGKEKCGYVDEMQKYLSDEMGGKGNEASNIVYGIDIFTEQYYFPLKSAEAFIFSANQPAGEISLKNSGMTKELVPHANNPIVLEDFDDVWAEHVNKMSTYHGFVVPIDNFNKVMNYTGYRNADMSSSVQTTMESVYGLASYAYMKKLIQDLNGGVAADKVKSPLAGFVGKFKKTAVAASGSVVIQQPTAIVRAMSMISPKYFKVDTKLSHGAKWEQLKKYAPVAVIKEIGGFDAGSGKTVVQYLNGNRSIMEAIDEKMMRPAGFADELGWNIIWDACKNEIADTTNLTGEELLQKAGERFSEVIRATQVYDSTLSRSGYMRSQNDVVKMATAFMGEPTTSFNMMLNAFVEAKRGTMSKGKAISNIAWTVTAGVAACILKSLFGAARKDDDDEAYLNKYVQVLAGNLLDELFIPNMLPFVKDVVSIMQGWDVERTDMALVKDLYDAFDGIFNDNKSLYRKIEDFGGAIGNFFGIPAKNIMRDARSLYNVVRSIFDDVKPENLLGDFANSFWGELVKSATLGRVDISKQSEQDRFLNYVKSGKSSEAKEYYASWIDSKKEEVKVSREKDGKTELNETELEKEAKSRIKSSVSAKLRPQYIEAYKNKDNETMAEIRYLMRDTGLYGGASDIIDTCNGWVKEYKKP